MGDIFKQSKVWSYLGMGLTVAGTACTAVAAILSSREQDAKILEAVQKTIQEGFKIIDEGAKTI